MGSHQCSLDQNGDNFLQIDNLIQLSMVQGQRVGLKTTKPWNRPAVQIPQCTSPISHNAPFCNKNVHIFVTKWCIVGYFPKDCGISELGLLSLAWSMPLSRTCVAKSFISFISPGHILLLLVYERGRISSIPFHFSLGSNENFISDWLYHGANKLVIQYQAIYVMSLFIISVNFKSCSSKWWIIYNAFWLVKHRVWWFYNAYFIVCDVWMKRSSYWYFAHVLYRMSHLVLWYSLSNNKVTTYCIAIQRNQK